MLYIFNKDWCIIKIENLLFKKDGFKLFLVHFVNTKSFCCAWSGQLIASISCVRYKIPFVSI